MIKFFHKKSFFFSPSLDRDQRVGSMERWAWRDGNLGMGMAGKACRDRHGWMGMEGWACRDAYGGVSMDGWACRDVHGGMRMAG